jgi:hypothetical protein
VSNVGNLKLETLFQYWNLADTQRVARRFQRGAKATNTAAARKVITDSLTKNLPDFLASLSLEEHQLLWRVRLAGGVINGWSLVSFAALAGWVRKGNKSQVYGYREMPVGANFLRSFVENGILIPNNTQINSWSPESRYYGTPSGNDDLIGADHRILEAITEPPKLEFTDFDLPEVPLTAAPVRAFIAPLLELHEAYRAVQLEGRLPLTQEGSPHKGTLKRMQKSSALLADHELTGTAENWRADRNGRWQAPRAFRECLEELWGLATRNATRVVNPSFFKPAEQHGDRQQHR